MKPVFEQLKFESFLTGLHVLQEQKQQEKLAFEKHLEEKQREHTQLVMMKNSNKENILNSVRQVITTAQKSSWEV